MKKAVAVIFFVILASLYLDDNSIIQADPAFGQRPWILSDDCTLETLVEGEGCWDTVSDLFYISDGVSNFIVGPGFTIGNPISGGTANSVLFIDSSGNVAQDNTGITYVVGTGLSLDDNLVVTGSGRFDSAIIDSSSNTSVNSESRILVDSFATTTVDWSTLLLSDASGFGSVDWANRTLLDTSGNTIVDWNNRALKDGAGNTLVDWSSLLLTDGSGTSSLDWSSRLLNDSSAISALSWNVRELLDSGGTTVLSWAGQSQSDSSSFTSINWGNRELIANNGSDVILNWANTGSAEFNDSQITTTGTVYAGAATITGSVQINTSSTPLSIQNTSNSVSVKLADFKSGNKSTPADNDEGFFTFQNETSSNFQTEFSRFTWIAADVTNSSKDGRLEWATMVANVLTTTLFMDGTQFGVDGEMVYPPSGDTSIVAGTGIVSIINTIVRVAGSGGAVDITANPQIEAGADGQILIVQGTNDTNTVTLDDGTGLALCGGVSMVLAKNDNISLMYDLGESEWLEWGGRCDLN